VRFTSILLIQSILFLHSINIIAQATDRAYSIGDKFPDYSFNIFNGDSSYQFTIDEYKGKSIIIQLWDIHCSGCIYGIKKLDSLQVLFPDKLKVILVTKNSWEQVEKLFSRKTFTRPRLPSVVSDTTLYDTYFPHDGDPLHVWIDNLGIIKYITGGYNATFENVKKFLNNEPLKVAYQTKLKDFNSSAPLIEEAATRLRFYTTAYSLFTMGLQNLINTNRIEILKDSATGKPYLLKALNASKLTLYQMAYNPELYGLELNMFRLQKNNRIILSSRRADSLKTPNDIHNLDNWRSNNYYCYELFLPLEKSRNFFQWMQHDLQRFFNLETDVQQRNANCLILFNIENKDPSLEKISLNQSNISNSFRYEKRDKMATTIKELIYLTQDFNLPLVDETNIHTNFLINFPSTINNIFELNCILNLYGLSIKEGMRNVDFLIIK